MRTVKTLIRLGGCPGWSESSLGAYATCWFCHVAAQIFKAIIKGTYASVVILLLPSALNKILYILDQCCFTTDDIWPPVVVDQLLQSGLMSWKLTFVWLKGLCIFHEKLFLIKLNRHTQTQRFIKFLFPYLIDVLLECHLVIIFSLFFGKTINHTIWAATWQNQQSECAPSEDSDQPGHLPSLISLRCPHEESLSP